MAQLPWAPGVCQVAASELEDPNALVDVMLSVRASGRDGTSLAFLQAWFEKARSSMHEGKRIHCAYAALVGKATDDNSRPLVATATRFVSYCWQYPWRVVFSALESFERQQAEPSYFFIGMGRSLLAIRFSRDL